MIRDRFTLKLNSNLDENEVNFQYFFYIQQFILHGYLKRYLSIPLNVYDTKLNVSLSMFANLKIKELKITWLKILR